jgi:hypothetical protein
MPVRILEVRCDRARNEWDVVPQGRKLALLVRGSKVRAMEDGVELLRENGGGAMHLMNETGKVVETVWVLGPRRGISSRTPRIEIGSWPRHRKDGWKFVRNIPLFGFPEAKPTDGAGRQLIDLLQALIGRDNVARGNPCMDGVPAAVPGQLGLFVRCSHEDLAKLRSSVSWYYAAFLPDLS